MSTKADNKTTNPISPPANLAGGLILFSNNAALPNDSCSGARPTSSGWEPCRVQVIYGEDGLGQMENPEHHYYRYLGRQ